MFQWFNVCATPLGGVTCPCRAALKPIKSKLGFRLLAQIVHNATPNPTWGWKCAGSSCPESELMAAIYLIFSLVITYMLLMLPKSCSEHALRQFQTLELSELCSKTWAHRFCVSKCMRIQHYMHRPDMATSRRVLHVAQHSSTWMSCVKLLMCQRLVAGRKQWLNIETALSANAKLSMHVCIKQTHWPSSL
jgi:hypothetical protein